MGRQQVKIRRLNPGDRITVRSPREISSSLDESGRLEGLPFLSEMVKYCGRSFRVRRSVHKLIQEGVGSSMRCLKDVVLLEGTTCDGTAHEGCQRACYPLWKTAWLRKSDEEEPQASEVDTPIDEKAGYNISNLGTREGCQASALYEATTELPIWDPRRHLWDITDGNYGVSEYFCMIARKIHRKLVKYLFRRATTQSREPIIYPELGLQPGEMVEVKSKEEISSTLDSFGKCGGLRFMAGMEMLCGTRLRVLQRLDRMISEKTGKIVKLRQTVLLEGALCDGKRQAGCQRTCHFFWKEAWLRRAELR